MASVILWGWDASALTYRRLVVDASGNLQVDVVAAPALASQCYGYDGEDWQTLLVESATNFNLRTRLYAGANAIGVQAEPLVYARGQYGLHTLSGVYGWQGANMYLVWGHFADSDAKDVSVFGLDTINYLHGFNGATWDRLRTYGVGILKVGKGNIGTILVRKTAVGLVAAGARELHQVCINPSAGNAVVEFTDAITSGADLAWDMFFTSRETHHYVFDPPVPFATGIYLETLTNITAIMLCYV